MKELKSPTPQIESESSACLPRVSKNLQKTQHLRGCVSGLFSIDYLSEDPVGP